MPSSNISAKVRNSKSSGPVRSGSHSIQGQCQKFIEECKGVDRIKRISPTNLDRKEIQKIVGTSGKLRPLKPRSSQPRLSGTLLPRQELERLKKASKVISLEETIQEIERIEAEKKRIEKECENRKRQLREIDEERQKLSNKISKDDNYDEEEKAKVLDRAFLMKHEQEEEVKEANRIILAAKCHMIRHAQIQEKLEMAREHKEEELRLEKMMEQERVKSFKGDDEKLNLTKEQNMKHALEIKRQLEERERLKLIEAEEIEAEAKKLAQAKAAIERDEEAQANRRREKTAKLRADLQRVSELSALFKKMEFDQEREAEMKVQEYMKTKEEREKKLALERKLAKEALERKQERLINLQQKILSNKQELNEMNIRREQEEKEREFRRKEKEAAMKRKQIDKELEDARLAQLTEMNRRRALQLERDEADFKRICEKLKEEEARDKQSQQYRLQNKTKYREEIWRQIREKAREREELQRRAKNEYLASQEKEKLREKNIQTVIKAKLDAMRNANMPDKFIKDVEKQLKVTAN